ncbi:putative sucrose transport protein SUC6 [Arachis hypogaea]|uniref:putative sucrose transport protein SUC6 n=1 Tax=Arachis hypogaea TaxID=3818 RepID=UPI000DECBE6F|nr:sucrose transport protein SUC1-like [Arachis hypogaea]
MLSILEEVFSKGVPNVFGESNSKKSYGGANGTCKHKRTVPPPEFTALTRWIPTAMEATKTYFHTEIGSAGVEPDSVGELMAIEEEESGSTPAEPISVWKLVLVASIAVGIHLVNAVQIARLIPIYVEFGIPDKWTYLVWLVGAVSSSVFHPLLSYYSNTCKLGWRHHPFMFVGAVGATIPFWTIGFAKDIGYAFGDNLSEYTQYRALIIFGIELWMLEISINMIDARCRDFLGDLASRDQPKNRLAYRFFSFIMAVRNELGYLAALFSRFDVMLAFTMTKACDRFCANSQSFFYRY